MPAFRIAAGVLELMGGGGGILSGLQSIASGMSSFIKNSQFQFGSQIFGFFASAAASSGGGAVGGTSSGDGATADAGSSGGGVDSGGVDSGGGPINLGTGGFNYLEKTSTGNYEVNTFRPYEPYDGATTFTLVREAQNVGCDCPGGQWRGNGISAGGVLMFFGYSSTTGTAFCVNNPSVSVPMVMRTGFFGPGLGGGVGKSVYQIEGAPNISDLYGDPLKLSGGRYPGNLAAFGGFGAFGVGSGVGASVSETGFQVDFGFGGGAGAGMSFTWRDPQ
jgi:hypothetical protein